MIHIIQADSDEFRRSANHGTEARLAVDRGELGGIEARELLQVRRRIGVAREVLYLRRQIAQLT